SRYLDIFHLGPDGKGDTLLTDEVLSSGDAHPFQNVLVHGLDPTDTLTIDGGGDVRNNFEIALDTTTTFVTQVAESLAAGKVNHDTVDVNARDFNALLQHAKVTDNQVSFLAIDLGDIGGGNGGTGKGSIYYQAAVRFHSQVQTLTVETPRFATEITVDRT